MEIQSTDPRKIETHCNTNPDAPSATATAEKSESFPGKRASSLHGLLLP